MALTNFAALTSNQLTAWSQAISGESLEMRLSSISLQDLALTPWFSELLNSPSQRKVLKLY